MEIIIPGDKRHRTACKTVVQKALDCLVLGVHRVLVDLFPPGRRDPNGMHAAIWDKLSDGTFRQPRDKPFILASYYAGAPTEAFVEPLAFGAPLRDMPLFLDTDLMVNIPLESTYLEPDRGVQRGWKDVLDGR